MAIGGSHGRDCKHRLLAGTRHSGDQNTSLLQHPNSFYEREAHWTERRNDCALVPIVLPIRHAAAKLELLDCVDSRLGAFVLSRAPMHVNFVVCNLEL
jgi:hypothetical protein